VSLLSIVVLARYSRALERVFRENYDSAVYCNQIKESLDGLNSRAQTLLWTEPAGPGIPSQYASRVFEKFFRVSKNDGPSGVGLGLAIAKEIVEMHGGRITFRARVGCGCEFTSTLPAAANIPAAVA
jgi:K+-sensing histidine kinase KdpD